MCTVTFLPYDLDGFLLTSNRDEMVTRKNSLVPTKYFVNDIEVYFPKDQEANGTWIASSCNGFTLCLLNGAFERHSSNPPYKRSRGLVLLDFFEYNSIDAYLSNYDFEGVEPFTLILIENDNLKQLVELRWDGISTHTKSLDFSKPYIWSSATLYSKETISLREKWFRSWLVNNPVYTPEQILFFHHFAGNDDGTSNLIMQGHNRKTVSITSVVRSKTTHRIIYEDLVDKVLKQLRVY